jgi:hypothetical protein
MSAERTGDASTLTRTWPPPGSGSGMSITETASGGPGARNTTARIFPGVVMASERVSSVPVF